MGLLKTVGRKVVDVLKRQEALWQNMLLAVTEVQTVLHVGQVSPHSQLTSLDY